MNSSVAVMEVYTLVKPFCGRAPGQKVLRELSKYSLGSERSVPKTSLVGE